MSQSQPTSSFPPPPSTSTAPLQSAASEVSEGSTLSAAIININRNIASMQAAWAGLVQQPSPLPFSPPPLSTGVPSVSSQPLLPPSSFPYGMPVSGPGVPLNLLRWPASPSLIPSWAMGSAAPPVYSTTVTQAAAAPTSSSAVPQAAPKFYKLEFPTYDGSVDPLNWLNQCEQFFRGQQTMAS
ncbi:lysine-rich arabinogalactan protein 19-like [Miscanthus floridulus]|uniref:lysine-rich arabinogalactan protein 19-like n=1 Tax=Miscanthus floridulus TaxID=154761 RepID=UPI0034582B62